MDAKLKDLQSKEQLYQYLETNKYNKDDILCSRDLRAIIDAVDYTVQQSTYSTQNFLLQRRFNLFYSYYPNFFQHVPNHAIVEVSAPGSGKFIDLELSEEFALKFDDEHFKFQAAIPFALSPFQVSNCYMGKNTINIELGAVRSFRFNRNRFLLGCDPLALKNYQIYHLVGTLRSYKSAKMILYTNQLEKPLIVNISLDFDIKLNIDKTQESILRSLSQAIFSSFYVKFDSLPEDYLFDKIMLEIEVSKLANIVKPLTRNSIRTNLLPVFNLFDDYAMKIDCDYSQESYAIQHLDGPKGYVPTKLYDVQYNGFKTYHSYLNLSGTKSYNLMFQSSGHMRIAFLDPSIEDLSQESNEVVINAQWTQIASAEIEKRSYTFLPLSRVIGNLKFNIIYSYGFKRNQLLERADNILKVLNIINATGLDIDIFKTLISLISNHDTYVVEFVDKSLVGIESIGQFSYVVYIINDLCKSEFMFYTDLVDAFLAAHLSRRIGIQINLQVKVK